MSIDYKVNLIFPNATSSSVAETCVRWYNILYLQSTSQSNQNAIQLPSFRCYHAAAVRTRYLSLTQTRNIFTCIYQEGFFHCVIILHLSLIIQLLGSKLHSTANFPIKICRYFISNIGRKSCSCYIILTLM